MKHHRCQTLQLAKVVYEDTLQVLLNKGVGRAEAEVRSDIPSDGNS